MASVAPVQRRLLTSSGDGLIFRDQIVDTPFETRMPATTDRVHFLILPEFPLYAIVPATDALRIANQNAGLSHYDWAFVSPHGGDVRANNGMTVANTLPVAEVPAAQCVIVCAGNEPVQHLDRGLLAWLRRLAVRGTKLGSLDTGAFALAAAGVLGGYRITLHWEAIPVFREMHPALDVVERIFVIDRDRLTAAGGIASLDLMLALIEASQGPALAQVVANGFVHGRPRPEDTPQRFDGLDSAADRNLFRRAVSLMKGHVAFPLAIEEVAGRLRVSRRQLERIFLRNAGDPPAAHYLGLRLEAARDHLFYTSMPVGRIAEATGFLSAAHFCRAFRARYGDTPSVFRRNFESAQRQRFRPTGPHLVRRAGDPTPVG
jgi:AraC family carnitine catabolism transcriptional activator